MYSILVKQVMRIKNLELRTLSSRLFTNGEPAVLIHHGIVRRWRCGSLVTQRPLSLLLSMT